MSVVLEPVVAETEEPVEVATETVDDTPPPESVVEATAPEQEQTVVEPITPSPKKRGRPRKDPATPAKAVAPKPRAKRAATAPVPAPPPSSSDEEEPISQADLETEIIHYLVQRKSQQQDRRRQLWSQLAGLG